MSNAELIEGLRHDARDYGREVLGLADPGEVLSWDERHKRAWLAADALESAEIARGVLAFSSPTLEQIQAVGAK